jgi:2-succinyl-5-enolpyruvyl-6-hydroxy-3-cyclohexene-1-carboxylate synthase
MKYPKSKLAQTILQLCKTKSVSHIVLSPGSRNAPLTIGFTHDAFFTCYSIVDERCAAFFALGLAQQLQQPVAAVCTSGSALLNYYPAVSEAFYSAIPLVVISADRPPNKIDIGDGQTIRQQNVFANHILYSANLREDEEETNNGKQQSLISKLLPPKTAQHYNEAEFHKALHIAITEKGPVHINAPFEEPLYDTVSDYTVQVKETAVEEKQEDIEPSEMSSFIADWNSAKRKIVLMGVLQPHTLADNMISLLANDPSVVVFTETTSNVHHQNFFPSIDKIIAPIETCENEIAPLQPELLLTFGGMIVSKKIKAFLRTHQPEKHYHIDKKTAYNTYFCLTHHFKTEVNSFFHTTSSKLNPVESNFQNYWLSVQKNRRKAHEAYLKIIPFSDFAVYDEIFKAIPHHHQLQLGNSTTIRYAQLFDLNTTHAVFCNRGTSGIDGSTSTAIGASLAVKTPTTLITGELGFFYDSNALWNTYIRNDMTIIVINNGGGGIFRILSGHKNTKNFEDYFETVHNLTAKHLCKMYGLKYRSASDTLSLKQELSELYPENMPASRQPTLLEVFTPRTQNDEILLNYFSFLKNY